jgi:aspartate/methionine/tyrosine aminotransferase
VTLHSPGWDFDADEVRAAFTPRTRALLLNSPHNPTGKVFSPEELAFLAALCVERDAICVTDEVYERLVYDGRHVPMAALPGMRERTVTISSLAKTFSLTGWKVGWAAAPPELTAAVRSAHQFVTFSTATPLQHAAAAALSAGPDYYEGLLSGYRERRDYLVGELQRLGFGLERPAGAYFACAAFERFGFADDAAFARHLVESAGVAVIPPSVFYAKSDEGKRYVRFAFCKKMETLREAVRRLEALRPQTAGVPRSR